jgi:hypothetical protein
MSEFINLYIYIYKFLIKVKIPEILRQRNSHNNVDHGGDKSIITTKLNSSNSLKGSCCGVQIST